VNKKLQITIVIGLMAAGAIMWNSSGWTQWAGGAMFFAAGIYGLGKWGTKSGDS
jgi:hypothetical protein